MLEQFISALRQGDGYQFICDHGHEINKSELCTALKEFIFVGKTASVAYDEDYLDQVADSIEEQNG